MKTYREFCKQFPIYTDRTGHWYGWAVDPNGQPSPNPVYRNTIKAGRSRKRAWRYMINHEPLPKP